MSKLADSVNARLQAMRDAGRLGNIKGKGQQGELAVMDIMHDYRTRRGGLLYNGFMYPYATDRAGKLYLGNIFWNDASQQYYDQTTHVNDEIDVLYVSHYRIFAIEVKSYHMKRATLTDGWMMREGKPVDKAPTAQAEKHARHLYHSIYDVLPDGDPRFIMPVVCFVDRVEKEFSDERSPEFQFYMPVVSINDLQQCIIDRDSPHSEYTLDIAAIEKKLKSIQRERTIE